MAAVGEIAVEAGPTARALAASPALRCILTPQCPPGWAAYLERCGGGFFHTPAGADGGGHVGEPVYVRILAGTQVVGVAAGVRRSCRLADAPRHFFFPSFPALARGVPQRAALDALVNAAAGMEAADLAVESFDATWCVEPGVAPTSSRAREEYVVPVVGATETWSAMSSGHRRQARRGDKAGWRFDTIAGEPARSLLMEVQQVAADRATARGQGFQVSVPALSGLDRVAEQPWGATMFAAWDGDRPLAAALIGWANRRAFYIMGGSTQAGYQDGASVWLHWRIISRLNELGFTDYNMGGASVSASQPDDPAHGLYRFKTAFGARVVSCRSFSWTLSVPHTRLHQLVRWLAVSNTSPRNP